MRWNTVVKVLLAVVEGAEGRAIVRIKMFKSAVNNISFS